MGFYKEQWHWLKRKVRPWIGIGDGARGGDEWTNGLIGGNNVIIRTAYNSVFDDDVISVTAARNTDTRILTACDMVVFDPIIGALNIYTRVTRAAARVVGETIIPNDLAAATEHINATPCTVFHIAARNRALVDSNAVAAVVAYHAAGNQTASTINTIKMITHGTAITHHAASFGQDAMPAIVGEGQALKHQIARIATAEGIYTRTSPAGNRAVVHGDVSVSTADNDAVKRTRHTLQDETIQVQRHAVGGDDDTIATAHSC